MKSLFLCLAVVIVVLATPAVAQQQKGDVELQFQGYYFRTIGTEVEMGMGNLAGKIGPYITDWLQVGVGPTLSIMTTTTTTATLNPVTLRVEQKEESNTTTTFGSTAFVVASLLTRNAKAVPYFGAQYFKQDFSDSEDKGSVGINAGVKFFFNKKTAFDVSGNYLFTLNEGQEGGLLYFAVGLSFLL
jgi:hypothetical protein